MTTGGDLSGFADTLAHTPLFGKEGGGQNLPPLLSVWGQTSLLL